MKKVLVVKLDHIGDFALAIPWLRSLANSYHLEVVVSAWNKDWQEVCPWVHKWHFVSFPGHQIYRENKPKKWKTILDLGLVYSRFWRNPPLVALDLRTFQADWRGRLVCYLTRARIRVGSRGQGSVFLNRAIQINQLHEFDRIGEIVRSVFPECQPCTRDLVSVRRQVKPNLLTNLVAHPGAGTPSKKWPESHWCELRALLKQLIPNCTWNWMGGPNDRALIRRLASPTDRLRECSTIRQGLEAIAEADLLICLDSAAAHMANLVQTPCITIFSAANDPKRWKALGQNEILFSRVPCSPCGLGHCPFPQHLCMENLVPDQVAHLIIKHFALN